IRYFRHVSFSDDASSQGRLILEVTWTPGQARRDDLETGTQRATPPLVTTGLDPVVHAEATVKNAPQSTHNFFP
ncbi:MAG: hypothetical protein WA230_07655, partial [Xanthobacteraceae bacterium]